MKRKAMEAARAVFVRMAFVVVLAASISGQHTTPAMAVMPLQDAQGGDERPLQAWEVTWTVRQSMYHKRPSPSDVILIEQYRLTISASYLTAFYANPYRWETEDFALYVEEDIENLSRTTCPGGNMTRSLERRWATAQFGADIPNDDDFGLLLNTPIEGEPRLGSVSVGTLDVTTFRHHENQDCRRKMRTYDSTELVKWTPTCVASYDLIGNEDGNEYTFHTDTYPDPWNCLGPILLARPPTDGEFTFSYSIDISARLVDAEDLIVKRLEVTQGLQDAANSMPLVQDRRTIVRAYIDTGTTPMMTSGVDGKLEAFAGGAKLGELSPINPGGSIKASPNPDWKRIDDMLNFSLPNEWTRQGPLKLKVTVNPDRRLIESNYTNNHLSVTVDFGVCKAINMGYVKVGYGDEELYLWPTDDIGIGHLFAQWALPIRDDGFNYYHWGDLEWPHSLETEEGGILLLKELATLRRLGFGPTPEYVVGWLPQLDLDWAVGLAWLGGREAWASQYTSPDAGRVVFAHELVHMLGRLDVSETTAGLHWFDVYNMVVKPAATGGELEDLMHPTARVEEEAWSSPQTYRFVYSELCGGGAGGGSAGAAAASAQATAADALLVSADVFTSTNAITGTLGPLLDLANAPVDLPLHGGDYCIHLKDANDEILDARCFDANATDEMPDMLASTSMVITRPVGLDRVELYDVANDNVLAARVASTNTPTVTVDAVAPASALVSGKTTIHWTGSDPDGDPLTYYVLYSRDDGATWRSVDAFVTGQSTTVDFASQPGTKGATGRIKVMVSDGFHTAEDMTDVPFVVNGKGPTAAIVAPDSGGTFSGRSFVALYGAGVDLEDGAMEGAALAWKSDKDGALGTGRVLEANLSPGAHTITLTATDSDGRQDAAMIQLTVTKSPADPATLDVYLPAVNK